MTKKHLENVTFLIDKIGNIIWGLDPSKAHGQDNISVCLLKMCGNTSCKPLKIIYKD